VIPDGELLADAADWIAYGILVAALEEGPVTTLRDAVNVLKRFSAPAGMLGESWLREEKKKLREPGWFRNCQWSRQRRLGCRPDHRHHPHPLSPIRHGDELLPVSTPLHDRSHPRAATRLAGESDGCNVGSEHHGRTPAGDMVGSARAGRTR